MCLSASASKRLSPAQPVAEINVGRLKENVTALSEKFPRDSEHPVVLRNAASFINGEFQRAGGKTEFQDFSVNGVTYANVIASFGPNTDDRIIVGAHYDSCGEQPGADDNASGVAGLIELAYLLARNPPEMRVQLVAYALEEPPYFRTAGMGSAVHAGALRQAGIQVRGMIVLECIGFFSDQPKSQSYPSALLKLIYPSKGNFIAVVGRWADRRLNKTVTRALRNLVRLPVESLSAPSFLPGVDFSDHLNFWKQGYKAVMVTDTAFFRNASYHLSTDTPATLDYERMGMVIRGVYAAIADLSSK